MQSASPTSERTVQKLRSQLLSENFLDRLRANGLPLADKRQVVGVKNALQLFLQQLGEKQVEGQPIGEIYAALFSNRDDNVAQFHAVIHQACYELLSAEEYASILEKLSLTISDAYKSYNNAVAVENEQTLKGQQLAAQLNDAKRRLWVLEKEYSERFKNDTAALAAANQLLANELQNQNTEKIALINPQDSYSIYAETGPDYIFLINKNLTLDYYNTNAARAVNVEPREIVGKNFALFFKKETKQRQTELIQKVFHTERPVQSSDWLHLNDGRSIYAQIKLTPIYEDGTVSSVLGVIKDCTREKIAEERAEEQERKYATIFDNIHNAIFLMAGGKIVDCNAASLKFFGFSKAEMINRPFIKLLSQGVEPDEKRVQLLRRDYEKCLNGEQTMFEFDYLRHDGFVLSFEVHISPFPPGHYWDVLAIIRNITQYKQALKALQSSEQRFKDIIERSLDGYYFFDKNYKLTFLNKAAEEITSYSCDEINALLEKFTKKRVVKVVHQIQRTVMGGTNISWQELKIKDKKGNTKWLAFNARRVYSKGVVIGIEGFLKDITVRKNTELRLVESDAQFKALFESSPYEAFGLTMGLKFFKINSKFLSSCGNLENKSLRLLRPVSLAKLIENLCADVLRTKQTREASYFFQEKERYYQIIVAPHKTEKKRILGYAGLMVDVTDSVRSLENKKKFAEALIASTEEVQRRISMEIHDSLLQILVALQTQLSLLKKSSPVEAQESFDFSESLLKKSIQEARNICYRLYPRLLDEYGLRDALEDLVEDIRQAGMFDVHFEWNADLAKLSKNVQAALYRVAQEALSNAMKHSHANRVKVLLATANDLVSMTISDDGDGFARQQQASKSKKGFGLLNMKERIELVGGQFALESTPGKGVIIKATIPLQKDTVL